MTNAPGESRRRGPCVGLEGIRLLGVQLVALPPDRNHEDVHGSHDTTSVRGAQCVPDFAAVPREAQRSLRMRLVAVGLTGELLKI